MSSPELGEAIPGLADYQFVRESLQIALGGDYQPPQEPVAPAWFLEDDGRRFFAVGERLFGEIQAATAQQPERFQPGSGSMYGCLVIARGIELCHNAYQTFCLEQDQSINAGQLVTALKNPKTVRLFTHIAGMHQGRAVSYELWLGLRVHRNTTAYNEFDFDPTEQCFVPNPEVFDLAKDEASRWALNNGMPDRPTDPIPNQCPARSLIPKLWERAVDIATEETGHWQHFRSSALAVDQPNVGKIQQAVTAQR